VFMSVVSEGCNTNGDSLGKCKKCCGDISVICKEYSRKFYFDIPTGSLKRQMNSKSFMRARDVRVFHTFSYISSLI
jgi:hypothetical protein